MGCYVRCCGDDGLKCPGGTNDAGKQNKGLIIGGLSNHNKKNLGIIYQLLSMGQVESTRRS